MEAAARSVDRPRAVEIAVAQDDGVDLGIGRQALQAGDCLDERPKARRAVEEERILLAVERGAFGPMG